MGAEHPAHRAPTAVLVWLIGIAIALNYIDRGAVSVAAPLIQAELGLSATAYGLVVSAFFWTYVPSLVLAGWLADRVSVHRLMAVGVAIWALATLLTGFAGGLVGLIAFRLLMGVGEGVAFPCGSKMLAAVPEARRGTANIALAAPLAVGPLVGTLLGGLILTHLGWREMFLIFGSMTLIWLLPWFRVQPAEPEPGTVAGPAAPTPVPVPYPQLLTCPSLWLMSVVHFTATFALYFVIAWMPLYLVKVRGYDIGQMALLTGLFYLVQALSGTVVTLMSDRLIARGRPASEVRRGQMLASLALGSAGIFLIPLAEGLPALLAVLVLTAAGFGPVAAMLFSSGQTLAGPASAGRWMGVQTSFGNLAGITGPVAVGLIVDSSGYGPAFVLTGMLSAAGLLAFALGIRRIAPLAWAGEAA
jgi:ACS family D-galactonate transporter-like MFS transporter